MAKKTRFVTGYALLVVVLLAAYVLYKLVVANWFAGVSIPTLLLYTLVFVAFVAGMWHVIENFTKAKKEDEK